MLRGKAEQPQASTEDINDDGLMDLVVQVETQTLALSGGDTEAYLTGYTYDGEFFWGVDTVKIVP